MLIEPKGLYNYMLPVLSECFIGSLPALETWPSKRAEKFQPYVSEENSLSGYLHLSVWALANSYWAS